MIDNDVTSDPFLRYISRLKDARLEQMSAMCCDTSDTRSARSAEAISARRETLLIADSELESAKAPSSRAVAEFADRTDQFLKETQDSKTIERNYLAKTRPGLLGLPKRLGLRAIRYPVKTYTDGLFAQQEAFNSLGASFIAENAERVSSLLSTGNLQEQKARLQGDINHSAMAYMGVMADAISSLWGALQEQREFNSQVNSLLNDVIDGSNELVASLKERTDQRLATCENRLDDAEDVLRRHAQENAARFEAAESRTTSFHEALEASLSETRNHIEERFDSAEARLDAEAGRIGAVEVRADQAESHLLTLDERRIASERRLDDAEAQLTSFDGRQTENQLRLDGTEGALRAHDERFEQDERRVEALTDQLRSASQAVQDTHSFFSLQMDAVDARIEHSQIRQHETSEWVAKLEARSDKSEEWVTNLAGDVDANKDWLANVSGDVNSNKDWLTNVSADLGSAKEWLDNISSEAKKRTEWLSGIEADVKSHSDWLVNLENTAHEHKDWLTTITERRKKLETWTGNLQETQERHASLLSDFERRQKEIDYQIVFVKRKLDESRPAPAAVHTSGESDGSRRIETGLSEDEYVIFENRFRGESSALKVRQERYLEHFKGCKMVIDLGCGRGEFLELLNERGIGCLGIDSNPEMIQICKSKGLEAEQVDLVAFLEAADDASFDGVFCSQVVEHCSPATVLRVCKLIAQKLSPGGAVVVETIDPRSIYALVNSFMLDPSHVFPVHPKLLEFCFSLTDVELEGIQRLAPVPESERLEFADEPQSGQTDKNFKAIDQFLFGFQDYALIGRKPKAQNP